MKEIILRLLGIVYRCTGYYSRYARSSRNEHIITNIQYHYDLYLTSCHTDNMIFEDYISSELGTWDINHGFYQTRSR